MYCLNSHTLRNIRTILIHVNYHVGTQTIIENIKDNDIIIIIIYLLHTNVLYDVSSYNPFWT